MMLYRCIINPLILRKMKAMECIATLLGGAMLGAAIAMLLTPYDGKQLRKRVCDVAKNSGLGNYKERIENFVEKIEESDAL